VCFSFLLLPAVLPPSSRLDCHKIWQPEIHPLLTITIYGVVPIKELLLWNHRSLKTALLEEEEEEEEEAAAAAEVELVTG